MADSARTIRVDDETSLSHVLAEADQEPVRVTKGSAVYRVIREDGAYADEAAAMAAAVDATSGSWSDLDADAVIDYEYKGREEGTRSIRGIVLADSPRATARE